MSAIKKEFVLTQDTYREADHSSVTELSRAMQNEGSWLSSVVTHMAYSNKEFGKQNFPMLFLTEGMGNVKKVKDFDYKYPVIGRPKQTSKVAKTVGTANSTLGKYREMVEIPFEDKHFANQQTLVTKKGVSVRVQGEPEFKNGAWYYTVQVWGNDSAYIFPELLEAGTVWGGSVFKVPFEDSYGVESRSYLGGTATNMTSLVRHSHKLKGNVQNKIMMFNIKADGQDFKYYIDWEMFLAELAFKAQCELDIWTSTYGRDSKGGFMMFDKLTGKGIPSGAGIDQQIPNRDSHSFLTYKKLSSIIRDITFNVTETTPNIEVWTGTGGMEDINTALKDELKGFTLVDSNQFASGSNSYDMVYGSYFKAFRHVDGAMVTFRQHPMFDKGIRGEVSDVHPISGLPKSSHDIYIIDRSTYDGENNIQYVMEEGREYVKWSVNGSIIPKGFKQTDSRASDRDSSSVHGMKSQGVQIMKPTGCYKSECI